MVFKAARLQHMHASAPLRGKHYDSFAVTVQYYLLGQSNASLLLRHPSVSIFHDADFRTTVSKGS